MLIEVEPPPTLTLVLAPETRNDPASTSRRREARGAAAGGRQYYAEHVASPPLLSTGVSNCDELRRAIVVAKRERNRVDVENATAENAGLPPLHSDEDRAALRMAVDMAAMEARNAGCDVDDLVGPHVGNLDDP